MANASLGTVLRQVRGLVNAKADEDASDRALLERFLARREEAAFAALLKRHGPMVLHVCRRIQGNAHDAEDAFQATFLLLARKAGSIRKQESVASWLHGVAHRLALAARGQGARRQARERRAADMRKTSEGSDQAWQELQATLDEALRQVPEKYRAPLLLCYLEGQTQEEAARQLGCPLGTVRSRLARGRGRLKAVLERQGIRLSAAGLATALAGSGVAAAVPATLLTATARAALAYAAGTAPAALVSARAVALLEGGLKALTTVKFKVATTVLLAVGALGLGAGVLAHQELAGPPQAPAQSKAPPAADAKAMPGPARKPAAPPPEKPATGKEVAVSGRVVDPDGQPVAGAKLTLVGRDTAGPAPQSATGPDGRFAFSLPPPPLGYEPRHVLASVPGFGLEWVVVAGEPVADATLRLTADLPITGKVIDLQGKAVAGATVAVHDLHAGPPGAFDGMVKNWKKAAGEQEQAALKLDRSIWNRGSLGKVFRTTTAADGSFTLTGFGQDRVVTLFVTGAGIADTFAAVATRTGFDPSGAPRTPLRLYPPVFTLAVSPDKPITGIVRDAATKAPLAGVRVMATGRVESFPFGTYLFHAWPVAEAATDVAGRFTLRGLAKAKGYVLVADPDEGTEHLHRFVEVADTAGFAAATADIDLLRGVVLTGRITDAATGAGVWSRVFYRPLEKNEFLPQFPGYSPEETPAPWHRGRDTITDAEGRYTLTVLPGVGVVHVQTIGGRGGTLDITGYLTARATKQDVADGIVDRQLGYFRTTGQGGMSMPEHTNAFRVIRPTATDRRATLDVTVRRGVSRVVKVVDAAGQPLAGAAAVSVRSLGYLTRPPTTAEFTAAGLDPERPRRMLFFHAERKLSGTALLDGKETDPVTVKLEPLGAVTGRLRNQDGTPAAGLKVSFYLLDQDVSDFAELRRKDEPIVLTDADGRFRLDDIPHGLAFSVHATRPRDAFTTHLRERIQVKPGEVLDLGTVQPSR